MGNCEDSNHKQLYHDTAPRKLNFITIKEKILKAFSKHLKAIY